MSDLIPLLNAHLPIEICKRIRKLRREQFYREQIAPFEILYTPIHYIKRILVPDNRRSTRNFYTIHWREHNIRYHSMTGHDIISDHLLFVKAILNDDPRAIDRGDYGLMIYRNISNAWGRWLF